MIKIKQLRETADKINAARSGPPVRVVHRPGQVDNYRLVVGTHDLLKGRSKRDLLGNIQGLYVGMVIAKL